MTQLVPRRTERPDDAGRFRLRRPLLQRPLLQRPLPRPELSLAALRPTPRTGVLLGLVLLLQLIVVASPDALLPLRVTAALVSLFVLPTVVLAAKLRWNVPATERHMVAFGLVLFGILASGLVWNTVGHALVTDRPLARGPVSVVVVLVQCALVMWRQDANVLPSPRRPVAWLVRPLRLTDLPALASLLAVVVAVLGAIRLNNQAGGGVALLGLVLTAAAVVALMLVPGSRERDVLALSATAAALLLGTSLRSWYLIGHDIQREYLFFQVTHDERFWDIANNADPYNACLSVTLLPSILVEQTGLGGVVIFKVVLPLMFALMPAITYLMGRRYLPRHLAVMAAAAVMAFPTFWTDLPYLLRQGTAFLFLSLVVLVGSATSMDRRVRAGIAVALSAGVVLSHYSTTYMLALTLITATGLRLVAAYFARRQRGGRRKYDPVVERVPVLLSLPVVVSVALMAVLWAGPITNTGTHVGEVASDAFAALTGQRSEDDQASEVRVAMLRKPQPPQEKLDDYSEQVLEDNRALLLAGVFVKTDRDEQFPRVAETRPVPPTAMGRAIESVGLDAGSVATGLRVVVALLLSALIAVGLFVVSFRRKTVPTLSEDLRWLGPGAFATIGLLIVVPGLSAEYGVLRSFLQGLLILAPVAALGLGVLTRITIKRRDPKVLVRAAVTGGILLTLVGVPSALIGGYAPQLHVANAGLYDDVYNRNEAEVAGIGWLSRAISDSDLPFEQRLRVGADMRNVVLSVTNYREDQDDTFKSQRAVDRRDFYPSTVPVNSYLYLTRLAVQERRSVVFAGGDLIQYQFPIEVVSDNKSRIYDNGFSQVYR